MSYGLQVGDFSTQYESYSVLGYGVASANTTLTLTLPHYGLITNVEVSKHPRFQIPDNQAAIIGNHSVSINTTDVVVSVYGHNIDIDIVVVGN